MDLSIIIVSFNTKALLDKALASVRQSPLKIATEVLVVDNASDDGSPAMIQQSYPDVTLIRNEKNVGFAKANNQALQLASGRYLLLLNSDAELVGGALQTMVDYLERNTDIGILGPQLLYPNGSLQPSGNDVPTRWQELLWITSINRLAGRKAADRYIQRHRDYDAVTDVRELSGACMMIRRKVWEEIGNLDENYFFCFEDVDYCIRAHRIGWRITYLPAAKVVHHWGKSVEKAPSIMRREYQQSRYRFYRKFYGRPFALTARGLLTLKSFVTALPRAGNRK